MSDKRTLDILQSLSPFSDEGHDIVTRASRELLLTCIRTDLRVHSVFFPATVPDLLQEKLDLRTFPMEPLAIAFVAEAIANIKDEFKFHGTINKGAVDDALRDIYGSLQWKKLGFQMYTLVYPEVVKDPVSDLSLKDYMGDEGSTCGTGKVPCDKTTAGPVQGGGLCSQPVHAYRNWDSLQSVGPLRLKQFFVATHRHIWAERLLQRMQEAGWTQRVQQSIVRGLYTEDDYNRDMNALFVKLHILDPQSVIPAYQFLLNQRALPAVNLELATRNYLGGPLDWRAVQNEVENAENRATAPLHVSRLGVQSPVEVFHGTAVDDFIVSECRNLGLWSGLRPDNVKVATKGDKCCVM